MIVAAKQTQAVERFLQFMIISDTKGLVYQDIIDRNIEQMLHMGIDLKPYFASNLPFHMIDQDNYPDYHVDDRTLKVPSDLPSLQEVCNNYQKTFGGII